MLPRQETYLLRHRRIFSLRPSSVSSYIKSKCRILNVCVLTSGAKRRASCLYRLVAEAMCVGRAHVGLLCGALFTVQQVLSTRDKCVGFYFRILEVSLRESNLVELALKRLP